MYSFSNNSYIISFTDDLLHHITLIAQICHAKGHFTSLITPIYDKVTNITSVVQSRHTTILFAILTFMHSHTDNINWVTATAQCIKKHY